MDWRFDGKTFNEVNILEVYKIIKKRIKTLLTLCNKTKTMTPTNYGQAKSLGYRVVNVVKENEKKVKVTMKLPTVTMSKNIVTFNLTVQDAKLKGLIK